MEVSTSHSCVVLSSLILELDDTMRGGEDVLVRDDSASTLVVSASMNLSLNLEEVVKIYKI